MRPHPVIVWAAFLVAAPSQTAFAEAIEQSTVVPRITLETGVGIHAQPFAVTHSFLQARLGYRLPGNEQWEGSLTFSPDRLGYGNPPMLFALGARHYWPQGNWLQPFAQFSLGYAIWSPQPGSMGMQGSPGMGMVVAMVGLGANVMITDHVGVSGSISAGPPFILRSELNLRLTL